MAEPNWPTKFSDRKPLDLKLRSRGGNSDPCVRWRDGAWHLWMSVGTTPPNGKTGICYSTTANANGQDGWSPIWDGERARVALAHGPMGTASWQGVEVCAPVRWRDMWWAYHLRKPGQGHISGKYGRWLELYAAVSPVPEGPFVAGDYPVISCTLPWEQPWVIKGTRRFDGGLREVAVQEDQGALRMWYLATSMTSGRMGRVVGHAFSQDGLSWHKLEDPVFTPGNGAACQQIDVIRCPTGGWYLLLVPERQAVDLWWSADGVTGWLPCPRNPIVTALDPENPGHLGAPTGQVVDGTFHLYCHDGPYHWTSGTPWRDIQISHATAEVSA